jgi:hypothetical protein
MKVGALSAALLLAAGSALVIYLVFANSSSPGGATALIPTRTPSPAPVSATPTPFPHEWSAALHASRGAEAILISCLDHNGDGRLDGADSAELAGLSIPLVAGKACNDPQHHRDFYAGPPSDSAAYSCVAVKRPLLIVAVGSAGSELLDTSSGESPGELQIVAALQDRAAAEGIATDTVLATSAVFGADQPQTRMEQWLEHDLRARLDALPCLRAVMIGHSHGAVTVTSVTAALDGAYAARLFGVLIDRTTALYDRPAAEYPSRTPLLNIFQTNEGWHGEKLDLANATNFDASKEQAPIAPSDGGGGPALVSHKTLDDSPVVQQLIEDAVTAWLTANP